MPRLKYVNGTNLAVHCARCLKGEYSRLIQKDETPAERIVLDEFPANIVYFCGVALPFNWENNFHLALIEKPGGTFSIDEKNISVTIRNAERLPINTDYLETVNHPKRIHKSYYTCRNWQFANYLSINLELLQVG